MLPLAIILIATVLFFVAERILPGASCRKRPDGMPARLSSIYVRWAW